MSESQAERPTRVRIAKPVRAKVHRPAKGYIPPNFDSMFGDSPAEPTPDVLAGVTEGAGLEATATGEVSAALAGILAERKAKRDAYRLIADSEYWLCVCFQSREQKERFLEAKGWGLEEDKYVNGLRIARLEGVPIEPVDLPARENRARLPKLIRDVEIIR